MNRILEGLNWRFNRMRDKASRAKWYWVNLTDRKSPVDKDPRVALVVVGRNDNYGGDFRGRLDAMLEWNLQFPFAEAIYIEWNPIPDQPSDAPWLVEKFKNLRVYIVSPERHKKCCTNLRMPMMEYFAKNVGIRRAVSPWIGVINADVLLGLDMLKSLKTLRTNYVYGSHSVNIRWNEGSIRPDDLLSKATQIGEFSADRQLFSVSGNFTLASRASWNRARGYDESLTGGRVCCDAHGLAQLYHYGDKAQVLGTHYHLDHPESCRNAVLEHQGQYFDPWTNVPYNNNEQWGQADAQERLIGERTYYLD